MKEGIRMSVPLGKGKAKGRGDTHNTKSKQPMVNMGLKYPKSNNRPATIPVAKMRKY